MFPQEIYDHIVSDYATSANKRDNKLSTLLSVSPQFYYPARKQLFRRITLRYVSPFGDAKSRQIFKKRVGLLNTILQNHKPTPKDFVREVKIALQEWDQNDNSATSRAREEERNDPGFSEHHKQFISVLQHLSNPGKVDTLVIKCIQLEEGFLNDEPEFDMEFDLSALPLAAVRAITTLRCLPSMRNLTLSRIADVYPLLLTGIPGQDKLAALTIKTETQRPYAFYAQRDFPLYPFTKDDLPSLLPPSVTPQPLVGNVPFASLEKLSISNAGLFPWAACKPFVLEPRSIVDDEFHFGDDSDFEEVDPGFRLPQLIELNAVGWECGSSASNITKVVKLAPKLQICSFDVEDHETFMEPNNSLTESLLRCTSLRTLDVVFRSRHDRTMPKNELLDRFCQLLGQTRSPLKIQQLSLTIKWEGSGGDTTEQTRSLLKVKLGQGWTKLKATLESMPQLQQFHLRLRPRYSPIPRIGYLRQQFQTAANELVVYMTSGGRLAMTSEFADWEPTRG